MPPRLFVVALLTAATAFAETAPTVFSQVDEMVATLAEITGWPVKKKVPSEILSKDKFQHYLSSHIKDSSHDKETRAEELALKMFGLVPAGFQPRLAKPKTCWASKPPRSTITRRSASTSSIRRLRAKSSRWRWFMNWLTRSPTSSIRSEST